MSVDSASGAIFVSQLKPIGAYTIKVIGTLPDLVTTTSEIFTIIVTSAYIKTITNVKVNKNRVPDFQFPLKNVLVPLMISYTYMFPKIIDLDYGDQTNVNAVEDSATGALPSFITLEKTSLTINPTLVTYVKEYKMKVRITDSKDN